MMQLHEIRRINGRKQIQLAGGTTQVARSMGYANPAFLSQVFGPNPQRNPTEKLVRRLEAALGLPERTLDDPNTTTVSGSPANSSSGMTKELLATNIAASIAPAETTLMVQDVIRLVGEIIASEKIDLSPIKALDLANLALTDALEHGGQPREQHIKTLVRLAGR